MQRMQRKFGRLPFMARTPNEADIEAMLRDFNDSDQMLKSVSTRPLWTARPMQRGGFVAAQSN